MPSVSILNPPVSPGDGGGVVSATRPAGRSSLNFGTTGCDGVVGDSGREPAVCDRFNFFEGGCSSPGGVVEGAGGERCEDDLELFGTWMPSNDSETDFRRVLYGIVMSKSLVVVIELEYGSSSR
jgi:hypothetical protein